ncbi:MAG TPA: hypothetical protein VFS36_15780 [Chitinophagaceae bacterium]|jgi:hypothetical protein|nr:hypothetical protein [Chitinophagaceae bacterium]
MMQVKKILISILAITTSLLLAAGIIFLVQQRILHRAERTCLQQIRTDFSKHKQDVQTIYTLNKRISSMLDSLLNLEGLIRTDTTVFRKIMNTRPYDLTILAYKNILLNRSISDEALKLKIAGYTAQFEGLATWKLFSIDWQWDKTARPYIFGHSIVTENDLTGKNLSDPVLRAVLYDRKMFALDVVNGITPRLLPSIDSILNQIDNDLEGN